MTAPPIGVMPRWRWLELRIEAVISAVARHEAADYDKPVVAEWREELAWLWAELRRLRAQEKP